MEFVLVSIGLVVCLGRMDNLHLAEAPSPFGVEFAQLGQLRLPQRYPGLWVNL